MNKYSRLSLYVFVIVTGISSFGHSMDWFRGKVKSATDWYYGAPPAQQAPQPAPAPAQNLPADDEAEQMRKALEESRATFEAEEAKRARDAAFARQAALDHEGSAAAAAAPAVERAADRQSAEKERAQKIEYQMKSFRELLQRDRLIGPAQIDAFISKGLSPMQILDDILASDIAGITNVDNLSILIKNHGITLPQIWNIIKNKYNTKNNFKAFLRAVVSIKPGDLDALLPEIIGMGKTSIYYLALLVEAGVDHMQILDNLIKMNSETPDNIAALVDLGADPTQLWCRYFIKRQQNASLDIFEKLKSLGLNMNEEYKGEVNEPFSDGRVYLYTRNQDSHKKKTTGPVFSFIQNQQEENQAPQEEIQIPQEEAPMTKKPMDLMIWYGTNNEVKEALRLLRDEQPYK